MSGFTSTQHADGVRRMYQAAFGAVVVGATIDGKPAAYTLPLPWEVHFAEVPAFGAVIEITQQRDEAFNAMADTATWRTAFAIQPADDADLKHVPQAVYVTKGGSLSGTLTNGQPFTGDVKAGEIVRGLSFVRIHATGTTAKGLVAIV